MRISKVQLAGLLVGAMLLGGVGSVTAQEEAPDDPPAVEDGERLEGHRRPGKGRRHHPGMRAIRSEAVLPTSEDGVFRTVRTDRGELAEIDGRVLVIDEADGETVRVPVDDDTRIHEDGEEASLDDLAEGDHVFALRAKEDGDADFVTEVVKALSAERFEELQDRIEDRRARMEACREEPDAEDCERPRRGPGGPGFGSGSVPSEPGAA